MTTERIDPPYVRIANDVDVWIQDQVTPPFHRFFMSEDKTDILLTSDAEKDTTILELSSGHSVTPSSTILLNQGNLVYQCISVVSVTGNSVTVCNPLPITFYASGTTVTSGSIAMNIDGSITPKTFWCRIGPNAEPLDIVRLSVYMEDNLEGDNSKYGGLDALTNGTFARYHNAMDFNLGRFHNNSDFIYRGGAAVYTNKAGGGNYSMSFEFDLKHIYGIVLRLYPPNGAISVTVNDDLSGLLDHKMVAYGQVTLGEV